MLETLLPERAENFTEQLLRIDKAMVLSGFDTLGLRLSCTRRWHMLAVHVGLVTAQHTVPRIY